jgi:hypothetical protein
LSIEEIIAALEAATGPSRELDGKIALSLRVPLPLRADDEGCLVQMMRDVPAYTASLDAALTLVPAGHFYHGGMKGAVSGFTACCVPPGLHGLVWHDAPTAPLAMCIAAVSARLRA